MSDEGSLEWVAYCGLLADVEQAVANCSELRPDDPTLPNARAEYEEARKDLDDFIAELLDGQG